MKYPDSTEQAGKIFIAVQEYLAMRNIPKTQDEREELAQGITAEICNALQISYFEEEEEDETIQA